MDYMEAHRLLERYGIRTIRSAYVETADQAVRFSSGKPIVMKAISQKALHKSRSGLVALNLSGREPIRRGFEGLEKRAAKYRPYRILAQEMVPFSMENIEIIVGGKEDQQFGKLVLLGLGGIYVEAFKDFSLRICPIGESDADEMIGELKSSKLIAGDEKRKREVKRLLVGVSRMLMQNEYIKELDLNPVILHGSTYNAVDLRILR